MWPAKTTIGNGHKARVGIAHHHHDADRLALLLNVYVTCNLGESWLAAYLVCVCVREVAARRKSSPLPSA